MQIPCSWLQTADFIEEFPCLVHKFSVILTAVKNGVKNKQAMYSNLMC